MASPVERGNSVTNASAAPLEPAQRATRPPPPRRSRSARATWTPVQARLAVRLAEAALRDGQPLPSVRALRVQTGGGSLRDLSAARRAAETLIRASAGTRPTTSPVAQVPKRDGATEPQGGLDDTALRRSTIDAIMNAAGIAAFHWLDARADDVRLPSPPDVRGEQVVMTVGDVEQLRARAEKAEADAASTLEQADGLRRHLLLETARLRDELRARFGTVRSTVIEEPLAAEPIFERKD